MALAILRLIVGKVVTADPSLRHMIDDLIPDLFRRRHLDKMADRSAHLGNSDEDKFRARS
jgi:hypothetical protein